MSFKHLFTRSLGADPGRLHFAAHSHHLWPDASHDGHLEAWQDAAKLADGKWEKVMDELWPAAQSEIADELGTSLPEAIVFASNTHELLVRIFSALADCCPVRVLTSSGEFHSARRQLERWEEAGSAAVERVVVEPLGTFSERFLQAARRGDHDLILVSQVMFGSGTIFDRVEDLAQLGQPEGPWVVIDGYHAFMGIERPFGKPAKRPAWQSAFYLAGGYKYAMSGEGCAFMHAPPEFGLRPRITGWFAEFEELSQAPGHPGYARDARRFLGATFDPSALYRFVAVRRMLREEGLTTSIVERHVETLQLRFIHCLDRTPLCHSELLNPIIGGPHARFLAFRSPGAQRWFSQLRSQNCITDVRGDVLRIGFGIYQDEADVDRLISILQGMM